METEKLIFDKKLEALEHSGPDIEYLVEGSVVGDVGMVPCLMDSEADDSCSVTIADGPFTGTSVTVSKNQIKSMDKSFLSDAASKLFK